MKDTGLEVDIYHRRKVYRLHITQTGQKINKPYKPRSKTNTIPKSMIKTKACTHCDSLLVNGVCMNKDCKINKIVQPI